MTKQELTDLKELTESSRDKWVVNDNHQTHTGDAGLMFFTGGEEGKYMEISRLSGTLDGGTYELAAGTYEGANPHIGEATFKQETRAEFVGLDTAIAEATKMGGERFVNDVNAMKIDDDDDISAKEPAETKTDAVKPAAKAETKTKTPSQRAAKGKPTAKAKTPILKRLEDNQKKIDGEKRDNPAPVAAKGKGKSGADIG